MPATDEMRAYTPGPWTISPVGGAVISQNPTGHDGSLDVRHYGGSLVCESIAIDANANLIAAAPDLLDALQHLLTKLSITDEEGLLEFAEPVAKARAAIAKATGQP